MNLTKVLQNCCDPVAIHHCINCKHAGECGTCRCEQRFNDIKNNCEKEDIEYDYCAYFEVA